MNLDNEQNDAQQQAAQTNNLAPWEEIEAGRFMPRRVRGSCRGLALG